LFSLGVLAQAHLRNPRKNDILTSIEDPEKQDCQKFKKAKKDLSHTVKAWNKFSEICVNKGIKALLDYELACYKAKVELWESRSAEYKKTFTFSQHGGLKPYWKNGLQTNAGEKIVDNAATLLGPFYHNDNCDPKCKNVHDIVYSKIAHILTELYPEIYSQPVTKIAEQIKQSYYREI